MCHGVHCRHSVQWCLLRLGHSSLADAADNTSSCGCQPLSVLSLKQVLWPVLYSPLHAHPLQALLRGVLPGSFPCALGPEPQVTAGLRRFVVIDENIHRLYGAQITLVCGQGPASTFLPHTVMATAAQLQLVWSP